MTLHLSNSWRFDVNETLTSEAHPLIAFGDRLTAAGWVILQSSNTATINASTRNDVTRWDNADAWEHWRDPLGNRDLTIQRGASNRSWRIYLGQYGDAFTGGGLTTAPAGSLGMVQLVGSGGAYDASFSPVTPANNEYQIGASQAGRGQTSDVFEFYLLIQSNSSASVHSFFGVFACNTPADGTNGTTDFEPWVCLRNLSSNSGILGTRGAQVATAMVVLSIAGYTSGTQVNPYSGQYDTHPSFIYDITGGQEQRKGITSSFLYYTTSTPPALDTFNVATEGRSMIRFGNYWIPWPHGVTTGTGSDNASIPAYGSVDWPFIAPGGWGNADQPAVDAAIELVLPPSAPVTTSSTRNRVWDTVAGGWHVWVTTNGADPTGISYDGPGTYGVDTSNYAVI